MTMKAPVRSTIKSPMKSPLGKTLRRLSIGSTQTATTEEDSSLSSSPAHSEKRLVKALLEYCASSGIAFSKEMVYRFAYFYEFDFERTKEAIELNRENHHLRLEMRGYLKRQFSTRTIFPLSGLKTRKDKMDVCYIQASRFDPNDSSSSSNYGTRVVENLCYVLNDLSRTREQCKRGVAVIINMNRCEETKLTFDLWMQVIMTLQGTLVPTTVNLVLMVDSPKWFQTQMWKTQTKPMLAESFVKRCRLIDGEELLTGDYLAGGCEAFLPTTSGGWKEADEIVEDYQDLKAFQDRQRLEGIAVVPEDL
mmetsp:Transcript_272/g.389  ORF Transcript_272/g.389 Transcript_272/m.389 type:complete len:307 (+) Transcript_272:26-946(+)